MSRRMHSVSARLLISAIAVAAFALLLALAHTAAPAYADGLSVLATCPENNGVRVPCTGRLWVQFDGNVAVVEENAARVSLVDDAGSPVDEDVWHVTLPDTQVEPEYRRNIYVDVDGLAPATTYHLLVKREVVSKGGSSLGADVEVAFTTAAKGEDAVALAAPVARAKGLGGGSADGTGAGQAASGQAETVTHDARPGAVHQQPESGRLPVGAIVAAVAVIIAASAAVGYATRRNKGRRRP